MFHPTHSLHVLFVRPSLAASFPPPSPSLTFSLPPPPFKPILSLSSHFYQDKNFSALSHTFLTLAASAAPPTHSSASFFCSCSPSLPSLCLSVCPSFISHHTIYCLWPLSLSLCTLFSFLFFPLSKM